MTNDKAPPAPVYAPTAGSAPVSMERLRELRDNLQKPFELVEHEIADLLTILDQEIAGQASSLAQSRQGALKHYAEEREPNEAETAEALRYYKAHHDSAMGAWLDRAIALLSSREQSSAGAAPTKERSSEKESDEELRRKYGGGIKENDR